MEAIVQARFVDAGAARDSRIFVGSRCVVANRELALGPRGNTHARELALHDVSNYADEQGAHVRGSRRGKQQQTNGEGVGPTSCRAKCPRSVSDTKFSLGAQHPMNERS